MRPTPWWHLVVLALVGGLAGYFATHAWYADIPSPPTFAPVWLAVLALAEGYTAGMTRARLLGRPGTKPIMPILVARLAALAKASSAVGALAVGAYVGFLVVVARLASPQSHTDTRTAVIGVACSFALVVAALLLERVCRVRRPPDSEPPP